MLKHVFIGIILGVIIVFTISLAISGDWMVYINNKPFNGNIYVSKETVMVNIEELSKMLNFSYEYNELTNYLKINDTVYAGPKTKKDGTVLVSLSHVASLLGAQYNYDAKAYMVTVQTFNTKLVPVPTAASVMATPTPQGQKGDEVKVLGLRELSEPELTGKLQFGVETIGLTGQVQNTASVTAKKVMLSVYVKDGYDKIQETLTKDMGDLKAGETKSFELFFRDGSIFYDPKNPAIIYRGIKWIYDNKVTFELEQPSPTPTPAK
ncbi:MAG TPA: hypothetical protein PL110_15305 [Candidatus Eremiobacteraeota bacterium]|nr:MAG: hypothetical protein BWY64_03434 [bacterium ADurb.Bin363]HPZ09471.1 hypothetical protein [Candidatus Eremiobacteraeota bacterium]